MTDISVVMAVIFGGVLVYLTILSQFLTVKAPGSWLCCSTNNKAKFEFEKFAVWYSVVWISVFGVVVVGQHYEYFDETHYMGLCVTLALPFLLQPIFDPMPAEKNLPLCSRYSFKANVWLAIFSFIGNYWYTHYFYSVLRARYTFPSWRLNDVPIPLYFATHFYFVFYHTMSNFILRKIETRYASGLPRTVFFWSAVFAFSYFTAFMETLTISSFPDYSFEDRYMAYTVGSAFYGIYFIVSFPIFYRLDEKCGKDSPPHSLYQTVMESFGASMIILCLLDFCRLAMGIPLTIKGVLFYLYKK